MTPDSDAGRGGRDVLLRAEGITKSYSVQRGWFGRTRVRAVNGVDLEVYRGEVLALVGESGSGKSTQGRLIIRLAKPSSGRVWFDGVEIGRLRGRRLRRMRRRLGVVFQNPYSSLNARMTVGAAIAEPLSVWDVVPRAQVRGEVARLLDSVGLSDDFAGRLPHAMSGGQRQRVAVARALSVRPDFVFADEVVSSLDVSAASEIVNLFLDLRARLGLTMVFATHDLEVARVVADRIAVMYRGEIVETRPTAELFASPNHEYTQRLLSAQLRLPADGS
jgi:ABC-type glutathione transport system ATPase component